MKKILYVVFDTKGEKINEETKSTVSANLGKEDAIAFVGMSNTDSNEMYCSLKVEVNKIINDVNNFDYVCLLPNGSTLNAETRAIFNEHQQDRDDDVKEVYLPLALYSSGDITVVMNKQVWNQQLAYDAGVLDIDLAKRQIDSTIFGSFVPTSLFFNTDFYNSDIKYYQQYFVLNNFADKHLVLGIQKLLVTINNWDFKLEDVSDEDKTKYFLLARENWTKKPVSAVATVEMTK